MQETCKNLKPFATCNLGIYIHKQIVFVSETIHYESMTILHLAANHDQREFITNRLNNGTERHYLEMDINEDDVMKTVHLPIMKTLLHYARLQEIQ